MLIKIRSTRQDALLEPLVCIGYVHSTFPFTPLTLVLSRVMNRSGGGNFRELNLDVGQFSIDSEADEGARDRQ